MVFWVFGYGSLVWNPGFEYDEKVIGYIKNYRRVFDLGKLLTSILVAIYKIRPFDSDARFRYKRKDIWGLVHINYVILILAPKFPFLGDDPKITFCDTKDSQRTFGKTFCNTLCVGEKSFWGQILRIENYWG